MKNKVFNENCLTTMSRMPAKIIDLTVTSPPYNMMLRVHKGKYLTRGDDSFSKKYEDFADNLPIQEYYNFHEKVMVELLRVSRCVIYNVAIVTGSKEAVFRLMGRFSSNIKDVVIWDKGHGEPAMQTNIINRSMELILILEDAGPGRQIKSASFERGCLNDIWRVKRPKKKSGINAAVMPNSIAGKAILNFSKKGDLIYDPFGGTGTTALMAEKYGRNWILSEVSAQMALEAEKALSNATNAKPLFF